MQEKRPGYGKGVGLVIFFEFMERGAYYGIMSFLSVYMTDQLLIAREDVGLIKGIIQPLLYLIPLVSGALADRFGYRPLLLMAFALLGSGYGLAGNMTGRNGIFLALLVMAVGAGLFKPLISGHIARAVPAERSSQAFGMYYWAINLGAFLFPLILVPWLKGIRPSLVFLAAALGTGAMILPTLLVYREQPPPERSEAPPLSRTLTRSLDILFAPFWLLARRLATRSLPVLALLVTAFLGTISWLLWTRQDQTTPLQIRSWTAPVVSLELVVRRNTLDGKPWVLEPLGAEGHRVVLQQPEACSNPAERSRLIASLSQDEETRRDLEILLDEGLQVLEHPWMMTAFWNPGPPLPARIECHDLTRTLEIFLQGPISQETLNDLGRRLSDHRPEWRGFLRDTASWHPPLEELGLPHLRSTGLLLLCLSLLVGLLTNGMRRGQPLSGLRLYLPIQALLLLVWFLPQIGLTGRVMLSLVSLTLLISPSVGQGIHQPSRVFGQHARFLLLILLYSGFWIIYFQMYDSVLWYVKAYVNPAPLNQLVNRILGLMGGAGGWRFDVEHVTVIAAGVIILLQLPVAYLVRKLPALPTMIGGIGIGTLGMSMLGISPSIWVFITGLVLFSLGEMTAHPKFISYVAVTAPEDQKGVYMGTQFLYGVFGSAIGSVLGARLYVLWVDGAGKPARLWFFFTALGMATMVALFLFDRVSTSRRKTT